MTRHASAVTRHERRLADRDERRAERNKSRRTRRNVGHGPQWRSPMILSTMAALAVGLGIIAFAVLQQPAQPPSVQELAHPDTTVPAALADGRTLGKPDAPVTVEIWSDFQCPACRLFASETEPSIITTYVVTGTAKLVYRDAAFQGQRGDPAYDESVESAAAARCAADQGKFWEMHNWIFANWNGENEGAFSAVRLRAMAEGAGVGLDTYDACLASGENQAAVRAETSAGVTAGVSSTPTIVINGQAISGALTIAQMSQLIEQAAATAR